MVAEPVGCDQLTVADAAVVNTFNDDGRGQVGCGEQVTFAIQPARAVGGLLVKLKFKKPSGLVVVQRPRSAVPQKPPPGLELSI
jgi:hypothetical protein